jgi:hypothetical protein
VGGKGVFYPLYPIRGGIPKLKRILKFHFEVVTDFVTVGRRGEAEREVHCGRGLDTRKEDKGGGANLTYLWPVNRAGSHVCVVAIQIFQSWR